MKIPESESPRSRGCARIGGHRAKGKHRLQSAGAVLGWGTQQGVGAMKWSDLTERQIRKAQAEGQFDNLPGAGKPLEPGDGSADAVGFRIMADAGVVPREFELRKAVEAQRQVLQQTRDPDGQRREMAKLADLELRLNIEIEARKRFLRD